MLIECTVIDCVTRLFAKVMADYSADGAVDWGASDKAERNVVVPHSACCLLVSLGLASG